VELRVRMDCERCEREVKKALAGMRGWCCVGHPPALWSGPLDPTHSR
jgi:copper chaperone CopZ